MKASHGFVYGQARIVRLYLKMKTSNVLNVLTKRPVSSTNIFLFNEPTAINNEICNYNLLESIKDGLAVPSKYNNDFVQFKVPNIVVAFSTIQPTTQYLQKRSERYYRQIVENAKRSKVSNCIQQHLHLCLFYT